MSADTPSVAIVGAGPAGLAAARALAARGVRDIVVLDRDDRPGGLPRFCHHPGFGWEYSHRLETGPGFVRRLLNDLDPAAVSVETNTSVLAVRPGPELEIIGPRAGARVLRPGAVLLATGIRERPRSARLAPGRRPERGVMTTGQLQQLVARDVPVGGTRAVVVGTEHVAFSVLLTARRAGVAVVAMIEGAGRVMSFAAAGWAARLAGVPIHLASEIVDIEGDARVSGVVVRGPGGTRRIACDTLVFSGDFVPDAALLPGSLVVIDPRTRGPEVDQYGRTTLAGVFAAGNVLRAVESSGRAALEGAAVGANIATHLGGRLAWGSPASTLVAGHGLAYAMPQRWSHAVVPGAVPLTPSLRAAEDIRRGRLRLSVDGAVRWTGGAGAFRRHRRLAVPAEALAAATGAAAIEIAIDGR